MSKVLDKALANAKEHIARIKDDPTRKSLARLLAILKRLAAANPEVEQPIAPDPPDTAPAETTPVPAEPA
jgi:hypothetical protein